MKRLTALLLFCFTIQLSDAQIAFQKIIGNANSSYPRDIIQLSDTNYLITGSGSGYGDYTANAFLMKIDQYGDHMWTRSYGSGNSDWAFQLLEENDGSILFTGYTNGSGNGGYDIWVTKTNANGDVQWSKTYGGNDWDFAYSIIKTNDNNYLIAGETYSYGNGNNDAFLLKIDQNGDSLWMQTYGGSGHDNAREVITTAGGNFVFIGSTDTPPVTVKDIWMVKTDANGNQLWDQHYGTTKEDEGHSLVLSSTNGNIIAGGTCDTLGNGKWDQYYFKTDSTGNMICASSYGGPEHETTHDVCEKWNGNGYIAGMTMSFGFGFGDMIVYYPGNNCLWTGGPSLGTYDRDEAWSIKETLDSGYILMGETENGPGYTNIFLFKVGSNMVIDPTVEIEFDISSIGDPTSSSVYQFYPNPSDGNLHFNWGELNGEITIQLYDLSGRIIRSIETNGSQENIDLRSPSDGTYLMEILEKKSGQRFTERIVIRNGR